MNDKCAARQFSDQMACAPCRLVWDTNDPDPPLCGRLVPVPVPKAPERPIFVSGAFRQT